MSSITIRKQSGDKPAVTPPAEASWDPWRAMRAVLSWDPFREMAPFQMFEDRSTTFAPAFDIKETKDAYEFKADLPGIDEKELEVTVTGNRLTVGGKREEEHEEKSDRYYAYERSYGSFSRSFTLPEGSDPEKLSASLERGVLDLKVPKKPEVQPKKIEVKGEAQPKPSK
jgi:HSP20 family protein